MFKSNKKLIQEADIVLKGAADATSKALKAVKELEEFTPSNLNDSIVLDKGMKDIKMLMEYRKKKMN